MKVALLKGNRFNPWHLQAYNQLEGRVAVTAFRAESEIQRHMDLQDDGSIPFPCELIHFDTQSGNPVTRIWNELHSRYFNREPRILPFHERLRGFDVVHTWELFTDWSEQAIIAKKNYGIPVATMVWDNIPFNMEQTQVRRDIKTRVRDASDVFLVHTERSRHTLLLEGIADERIVLFPPGVDTERFSPGKVERAQFNLADDEFVIGFVGWLIPRKGIDWLLLAFRLLLDDSSMKNKKLRLLMVGSPAHKEKILTIARRLGVEDRCSFLGPLTYSQMPDVFRAADVFVLPSVAAPDWQEQFGMSLIEAMASGTPVVSTYSGAIPEIVDDCGVLCQPNDFLSLAASLKQLILDETVRRQFAERGRERALQHFGLKQHAEALWGVYERLAR